MIVFLPRNPKKALWSTPYVATADETTTVVSFESIKWTFSSFKPVDTTDTELNWALVDDSSNYRLELQQTERAKIELSIV